MEAVIKKKKTKNTERRATAQQLHNAAQVGNIQEVQLIFKKHQNSLLSIHSHRYRGNSVLHTALYHNQDGLLLDYLLERNDDDAANSIVNSTNSKGYTPLDLSIMHCKGSKATEKLIRAGAHWKEKYSDNDHESSSSEKRRIKYAFAGLTPLDVARKYNHQEVVELLTRLQLQEDQTFFCKPVVSSTSKAEEGASTHENSDKLGKWHAKCPICKDTVRFPTSMSRILLDQEILEKQLIDDNNDQRRNGVQLKNHNKTKKHGEGGKGGRNRKKYIARKYLDQFISHSHGKAYEKLCGITYHSVQNMRLRKEISESMGVLSAVQKCCNELNGSGCGDFRNDDDSIHLENVFLIDLCSGRGLTIALGGALHDDDNDGDNNGNGRNSSNNFFLAIDRMLPHTVPHFLVDGENRKYLSRDVMSESLFVELQEIVSEQIELGRIPILVGMHLCGVLSERAVEFFDRTPTIRGIVLSPCCLPKKHEQTKGITKFRKGKVDYKFLGSNEESGELYNYFKWSHYLKETIKRITPCVTSVMDEEMHTEKNALIVGIRK